MTRSATHPKRSTEGPRATEVPPLRRNGPFRLLWLGSASSSLGVEIADIGYPLAVLALTGSPALAGLFGAVQLLATLICGLPAGQLVDRLDRRRSLLLGEGTRMTATSSVALATVGGKLTFVHLLLVATVLGAATPLSGTARMLLVRSVVPPTQLTAALTQDEVRTSATALAGPPFGGFLYGLGQALPFLATTVSFALSWLTALVVRVPPRQPSPPAPAGEGHSLTDGVFAGVHALLAAPTLRAVTLLVVALNAVGAPLVLIAVILLRQQGAEAWQIGGATTALAVGGLAGAALVGPLHMRLRPGLLLLGVAVAEVLLLGALSVPFGPWWIAAMLFCMMLGVPALRVLVDVLIFRQVPDERRGQVIGAVMTLFGLGGPIGVGTAGLLLEYFPARTATATMAGVLALGVAYSLCRRDLRAADWPATASDPQLD